MIADCAISILVARATQEMRKTPGLPVLVVAGWNALQQDMRIEMLGAQSLARCRNVRGLAEVTAQLGRGPWCLRFYHQPHLHAEPVPKADLERSGAKFFMFYTRATLLALAKNSISQSLILDMFSCRMAFA